jgi:hypothetical protein
MGLFDHEGSWWIYSKKDSRWNTNGRATGTIMTFQHEAELAIEEMKTRLGEPPDDLEWGCMKD